MAGTPHTPDRPDAAAALPAGVTPAPVPALPGVCQPSEGGLYRLPGAVLFSVGWHKDFSGEWKHYDADYCRSLAANFGRFKGGADPHLEPVAALGHEEEQARLKALLRDDNAFRKYVADTPTSPHCKWTDAPAAGWPEAVRFDEAAGQLLGDLERIPPVIAGMIDRGEVKFPSIEPYDNFHYRGTDYGPTLRRVSLLGNQPPGNKAIPPLGQRSFADDALRDDFGPYTRFADVAEAGADTPADPKAQRKTEQVTKLRAWGFPDKFISLLAGGLSAANFSDAYTSLAEWMADSSMGNPDMSDTKQPDGTQRKFADAPTPEFIAAVAEGVKVQLGGWFEEQRKALDAKTQEVKAAGDEARQFSDSARKDAAERAAAEKRGRIDAELATALKEGKVAPWELDEMDKAKAHLSLRQQLYNTDAKNVVRSFADGDGNRVEQTPLDIALEAIRSRPARQFGDRIPGQKPGQSDGKALFDDVISSTKARIAASGAIPDIPLHQRLGQPAPRHLR